MLEIVCSQNNNGKAVVQTAPEKTENSLRRLGVLKDEEKHGEDMKKWITKKGYVIYQVLSGRCNCFIVSNGSKFLLVDTGGRKKQRLLLNRLAKLRRNGESAAGIILTHAHFDHTENAAAIKAACNIPVVLHHLDTAYLQEGKNPPIRGTFRMIRFLTNLFGKRLEDFYQYAAVDADFPVHEYYDLSAWGFEIVLLHTPGHTPGSLSVIVNNEIALVGDAMVGMFKNSIYPPFACDTEQMVESWGKLLETGCSLFLPAHGTENSRELVEKQYNTYAKGRK